MGKGGRCGESTGNICKHQIFASNIPWSFLLLLFSFTSVFFGVRWGSYLTPPLLFGDLNQQPWCRWASWKGLDVVQHIGKVLHLEANHISYDVPSPNITHNQIWKVVSVSCCHNMNCCTSRENCCAPMLANHIPCQVRAIQAKLYYCFWP